MDAKEERLIVEVHRRIKDCSFHERDILALLILLRPYAEIGSPVRELGDFVAHREKDRGALKNYIQHVVRYVEAIANRNAGQAKIEAVHSSAAFHASLNVVLSALKLDGLAIYESDSVLVCVMSLLQDVRLFHNKDEIGRLGLYKYSNELWLCGMIEMPPFLGIQVVFPALIVQNRYCPTCASGVPGHFPDLVEAKCDEGQLRLYLRNTEAV